MILTKVQVLLVREAGVTSFDQDTWPNYMYGHCLFHHCQYHTCLEVTWIYSRVRGTCHVRIGTDVWLLRSEAGAHIGTKSMEAYPGIIRCSVVARSFTSANSPPHTHTHSRSISLSLYSARRQRPRRSLLETVCDNNNWRLHWDNYIGLQL